MAEFLCSVRVQLPRPLFRKLMAKAILERSDVGSIVVRAVRDSLPRDAGGPGRRPGPRPRR
ncbi:MAG TPA: hypothetical protein VGG34_13355 [Opitutaceae bacterium]|jgi:hypothetical protein